MFRKTLSLAGGVLNGTISLTRVLPWVLVAVGACYIFNPWAKIQGVVAPYIAQGQQFAQENGHWAIGVVALGIVAQVWRTLNNGRRRIAAAITARREAADDRVLLAAAKSDDAMRAFKQKTLDDPAVSRTDASLQSNCAFQREAGRYNASRQRDDDQIALLETRQRYLDGKRDDYTSYAADFDRLAKTATGDVLRRLSELSAYASRRASLMRSSKQSVDDSLAAARRNQDQKPTIAGMLKAAGIATA